MTRPSALPRLPVRLGLAVALASLVAAASPRDDQKAREAAELVDQLLKGEVTVNQAVNRISFLGQEAAASAMLAEVLPRPSPPSRKTAALQALAYLAVPHENVERALVASLDDDDVTRLRAACQALARIKGKSARPKLEKLLASKLLGVRRDAAKTLAVIGDPKSGAPLLKAAQAEDDPEARVDMLVAVGKSGDKKQAAALEPFLDSSSASARAGAAHALCLLGAPKGLAFAKKQLASEDRFERAQAVVLLDGLPSRVAGPLLEAALKDGDQTVRAKAGRVLYQGGDASKLEWLVVESYKLRADQRGPFEDELEALRLSDEQRQAFLKKAGLQ